MAHPGDQEDGLAGNRLVGIVPNGPAGCGEVCIKKPFEFVSFLSTPFHCLVGVRR